MGDKAIFVSGSITNPPGSMVRVYKLRDAPAARVLTHNRLIS